MANNAAGTILALGIVGGLAYLYRDKIKVAFGQSESGDFVNIPGSPALMYVGTPTDSLTPQFGTQDVLAVFGAGTNLAPRSGSNPFRNLNPNSPSGGLGITGSD
jgi:hypothetical protein